MNLKNNQNATYGKNATDACEERNARLQVISESILNARLSRGVNYTRGQAVEAVTRYIYRLYDYYSVYGEKTIRPDELAELLSNIVN